MVTTYKTQTKQRVPLNTMIDEELKTMLDEAKKADQISLAHLIDQILRQHFKQEKPTNGELSHKGGKL